MKSSVGDLFGNSSFFVYFLDKGKGSEVPLWEGSGNTKVVGERRREARPGKGRQGKAREGKAGGQGRAFI